jgi:hypothetical protein
MPYGNLLADVVQGSTANTPPVFKDGNGTTIGTLCRAWVNFNGTGTVAIRASFNVSSITDNGTGNYTVNFTNAMPDANYAVSLSRGASPTTGFSIVDDAGATPTASALRIAMVNAPNNATQDTTFTYVSIFR